jgi:hypothetical protein
VVAAHALERHVADLTACAPGAPAPPTPPGVGDDDGPRRNPWVEAIHLGLDVAGMVPVVGAPADVANAGLYAAQRRYVEAALSAAGAIPIAGDAATAARRGTQAARAIDRATDAARTLSAAERRAVAERISKGHAFDKHVVRKREFPGITTPEQFARHIDQLMGRGEVRPLARGRTAWWDEATSTIVIHTPQAEDWGTAYVVRENGAAYFRGLE